MEPNEALDVVTQSVIVSINRDITLGIIGIAICIVLMVGLFWLKKTYVWDEAFYALTPFLAMGLFIFIGLVCWRYYDMQRIDYLVLQELKLPTP